MERLALIILSLGVILCGSWGLARAQTTQPAAPVPSSSAATAVDEPWQRVVEQFAGALVGGDIDALRDVIKRDAAIRAFDSEHSDSEELPRLAARASETIRVGARAYQHPPLVMAADIAVDCKNAADLPDAMRQRMVPQDDAEMQRANATAAQWITEHLSAADGDLVGVIVLFYPGASLSELGTRDVNSQELLFVLVRGEVAAGQSNDDGAAGVPPRLQVSQIVYGNPLTAASATASTTTP